MSPPIATISRLSKRPSQSCTLATLPAHCGRRSINGRPNRAPGHEPGLESQKIADRAGQDDPGDQVEIAAMRGEAAEQHDRLALEQGADEDDCVAVLLNEAARHACAPLTAAATRRRAAQAAPCLCLNALSTSSEELRIPKACSSATTIICWRAATNAACAFRSPAQSLAELIAAELTIGVSRSPQGQHQLDLRRLGLPPHLGAQRARDSRAVDPRGQERAPLDAS